uniref:TTF-type domain-containing protein n=1 Tax=Cucumis melo TaxID=3656 RepID=A0A9I9EEN7_CUCME
MGPSSPLKKNPGLRIRILDYNSNIRDEVRRAYLQKGPCQPRNHTFPLKKFWSHSRRFNPIWFTEYPNWLEYSISKDVAYCLCCYLFKPEVGEQSGRDHFVGEGFSNWKKKEKLQTHVQQLIVLDFCYNKVFHFVGIMKLKIQKIKSLVYRLLTLALILPVTTATVERTFSAMSIIKTQLHNRMEDQWMNDCLVAYIERDLFDKIDNEAIIPPSINFLDPPLVGSINQILVL